MELMRFFDTHREALTLGLGALVSFTIALSGWPMIMAILAGLATILAMRAL